MEERVDNLRRGGTQEERERARKRDRQRKGNAHFSPTSPPLAPAPRLHGRTLCLSNVGKDLVASRGSGRILLEQVGLARLDDNLDAPEQG